MTYTQTEIDEQNAIVEGIKTSYATESSKLNKMIAINSLTSLPADELKKKRAEILDTIGIIDVALAAKAEIKNQDADTKTT